MTAEAGHHANRIYQDQTGDFHLNGSSFFDDNEVDIAPKLNAIGITSSVASAADALAMPVTARVVTKTTGADAEALTLADGTYAGQKLTIVLVTDGGGDGTLTPTTTTGFATVVLADAGDSICLEFVDSTVGWIITGASGVAAPPAITV